MQLLQNGKQQWIDSGGLPLANGTVGFYAVGTLNPLPTYQDQGGTIQNTNPLSLDSRGQAIVWGTGTYRQIVKDASGVTIWDQVVDAPAGGGALANTTGTGGAALIGFDGGTLAQFFLSKNNRVVDSIAALRALVKTTYTRAFVTGYYAAGDGGGGEYWYDPTDTTSADNGGTIIVASDGGRWKLQQIGPVSLRQFGAKGDDTNDDTAATQAAVTWCYTNKRQLFAPSGTYKITAKVTAPGPMHIVGEKQSPPVTPSIQQAQPQVTFHSTVAADYCFAFGSATYERGGHYENFRIYGAGVAGNGMLIKNQGWDGFFSNFTIESFAGIGMTLDFLQDSILQNVAIIDCGVENVSPSLNCINQCNIIKFDHLRVEITPFMMALTNSSDFYFSGCHFEASEYVSGPQTVINRYSRYAQITSSSSCTDIQFDSCIFAGNSVQGVASHFSVAPNTIDYIISLVGTNLRFSKCRFAMNGPNRSSRYLNFNNSSSTSVTECTFEAVYTDVNSITLSGTTFVNNDVTWMDDGVSTLMYGIANSAGGSPSIVENNRLYQNISTGATKTAGYLLNSQASGSYLIIGYNQNSVSKFFKHHNASSIAKPWMQAQTVDLTGFSGTLDLELYDVNTQFKWTTTTTVSSIINMCSGQRAKLWNNGVGTVTVANAGNVVLKGAVNAPISANGILCLEESGTGFLIEISRNF